MNKKRLFSCSFFIFGIILAILIKLDLVNNLDMYIYNVLISLKSEALTNFFKLFTLLGSTWFIVFLNIIVLVIYFYKRDKLLLMVPENSILSVIFNHIIKAIVRRPRPDVLRLVHETFLFLSVRARDDICSFYGTVIMLINKSNLKHKLFINIGFMLIIVVIGISRIYLGVHYFSDIIGGFLFGLSILLGKESVYEGINNRS